MKTINDELNSVPKELIMDISVNSDKSEMSTIVRTYVNGKAIIK